MEKMKVTSENIRDYESELEQLLAKINGEYEQLSAEFGSLASVLNCAHTSKIVSRSQTLGEELGEKMRRLKAHIETLEAIALTYETAEGDNKDVVLSID